jgi:hypothetical protein
LINYYMKVTNTPGNRAILMDALYSPTTIQHVTNPTPTFNVMFRDSSVHSSPLPTQVVGLMNTVAPLFAWGVPTETALTYSWPPVVAPMQGMWGSGGPAILTPTQAAASANFPTVDGQTNLGYAVGLSNYVDLLDTLGSNGNAATGPQNQTMPSYDTFDMMSGLRMGTLPGPTQ